MRCSAMFGHYFIPLHALWFHVTARFAATTMSGFRSACGSLA
jgi:hypothetical protein